MRKWLNVLLSLVMAVAMVCSMALPAWAAELPGVSIPVTISLTGNQPYPAENYTIVLAADNQAYPMPAGSHQGAYTLGITGKGTANLPVITFDRVGVYTYKIYQVAGTNKNCTYDATVYGLEITVTNKPDYSGLEYTVILSASSQDAKLDGVAFVNRYPEPVSETPRTGDDSNPMLYVGLVAVGMVLVLGLMMTRKKKEFDE